MKWTLLVVGGWLLVSRDAQAYIDPGTGSFILQMLIASILGALLTLKLWYGAAKSFFRRVFARSSAGGTPPTGGGDAPPPPADTSSAP